MGAKLNRPIDDNTERGTMGFDVPNGKYLVKVNLCEERTKKSGSDRYLHTELEILDASNRKGETSIGFKIFEQLSFSEKAEWRMVGFLDACYPPRFKGESIPDDIDDGSHWLIVETRVEEYEGYERPRCRSFAPAANWRGVDMKLDAQGKEIATAVDSEPAKSDNQSEPVKGSSEVAL
jgi:hypothetical protein